MYRSRLVAVVSVVALLSLLPVLLGAQSETTLSFTIDTSDTSWGVLGDGTYSMRFAIYDGVSSGSTRIWPTAVEYEVHSSVTVARGQFTVELGSLGQPLAPDVSSRVGAYVEAWLCTKPDGQRCQEWEVTRPRLPLSPWPARSEVTPQPAVSQLKTTSFLSVPGLAFMPIQYQYGNLGSAVALNADGFTFCAPVYLPHGAAVEEMRVYWRKYGKYGEDQIVSVSLMAKPIMGGDGSEVPMATLLTLGPAGEASSGVTDVIASPFVDNSQYYYWLQLELPSDTHPAAPTTVLGVVIEYSEPAGE